MQGEFISTMPTGSTPLELAVEQASGERWGQLHVGVIQASKDPWTCPEHLLNFLAFERSVDIWDESWPVAKKRQVIADAPEDHRRKGTLDGILRYVRHVGGTIERAITAPQGFYLTPGWSAQEQAQFLARLDQVRVHRHFPVNVEADGLFAGDSYLDDEFFNSEPSWHGYRKHAVLHRADGTVQPLDISWQQVVSASGVSTEIETILLPAEPDAGLYAEAGFFDEDFFDRHRPGERTVQIESPGAYHYSYGRGQFGVVFPRGLTSGVEPRLVVELAPNNGCGLFGDDDFFDDGAWMPDESWQQVYELYFINDPALQASSPADGGGSYFGDAWFDWQPYAAMLQVELIGRQAEYGAEEFWDIGFFLPPELERLEAAIDAIEASKALRDKTLLTTTTHRWPVLGDRMALDGSWSLGEMIKDR